MDDVLAGTTKASRKKRDERDLDGVMDRMRADCVYGAQVGPQLGRPSHGRLPRADRKGQIQQMNDFVELWPARANTNVASSLTQVGRASVVS